MQPALVVLGNGFHTPTRDRLEVLTDCAFVIDGKGRIDSILPPGAGQDRIVTAAEASDTLHRLPKDAWLIPGLVDLHIHAPQWPQLGLALDEPLEVWLQKYTFPLEARYADPPIITFQRDRSTSSTTGLASSICRMVGTQWEKVTFSR